MRSPSARRPRSGFTLVEMLVVIAIIITLAALLLPSVLKARDAAKSVQCVNNLREIGVAAVRYFDVNGYYPPYRLEDPAIQTQFAVVRPNVQWLLAPFVGQ